MRPLYTTALNTTVAFIGRPLQLLAETEDNVSFCSVLLESGIVKVLNSIICEFMETLGTAKLLTNCFTFLQNKLGHFPGYVWMDEALQIGPHFRDIVRAAQHNGPEKPSLELLLRNSIPTSLIYHSVVEHVLPETRPETRHLASTLLFQVSGIYEDWERFIVLADDRIWVMKEYLGDSSPKFGMCDNVQCNNVSATLKRQSLDWQDAFVSVESEHLSTRGRSFMRCVVENDYHEAKFPMSCTPRPWTRFATCSITEKVKITVTPVQIFLDMYSAIYGPTLAGSEKRWLDLIVALVTVGNRVKPRIISVGVNFKFSKLLNKERRSLFTGPGAASLFGTLRSTSVTVTQASI
ncbi:hypothetical protein B0H10DRAFT_1958667 [Mycena sp. CBHHK59/15]|nr:hypothetical protein B0H10DRAFT_1958667 [Mycena sp. CBHHK59/15]